MKTYYYEFEDDEEFEFEPSREDIENAIQDILINEANIQVNRYQNQDCGKLLNYIVCKINLLEAFENELEEELTEYFEDKAREEYKAMKSDKFDQEDWYGTKSNVIGL